MDIFKKKIKLVKRQALVCLIFALAIVIVFGAKVAFAEWREPDSTPPGGDFYAPLTIGAENQAKKGYLQLDPEYNPTENNSLLFGRDLPLDVKGTGARFSAPYVYHNILTVDTDTLFADAINDQWVGIGTTMCRGAFAGS